MLRPYLGTRLKEAQRLAEEADQERQQQDVLDRRDYAFCLYPEALLRPFLQQFLDPSHQVGA